MAEDDAAPLLLLLSRQEKNPDLGTGGNENMPDTTKTEANRGPAPTNSNTGASSRIIQFSDNNLDDDASDRVFETWQGMPESNSKVAFSWEVTSDDVQLKMLELIKVDDQDHSVRHVQLMTQGTSGQPGSEGSDFFEDLSVSAGSTNLNLQAFRDDESDLDYDDVYAVRLTWSRDQSSSDGESVSPYFTVMDGANDVVAAATLQRKVLALDDAETGFEDDGSGEGRTRPDSTDSGSNPSDVSETQAADASSAADSDNDSGGGGGGGGLSPGVIAGIVVGVVVFLALIGGLVFFLLRRRRKTKRSAGYGDAGQNDASNAYIVDKIDTSAQSPRSPYSDDGQEQHTPLDPHAHHNLHNQDAAAPGDGSNGSEYAGLYQANQHQEQHPQQDASRGVGDDGVQSPPRLQSRSNTGNYSHLVEEGMTEEDIRRLEEEERQLDAEIERRGRG